MILLRLAARFRPVDDLETVRSVVERTASSHASSTHFKWQQTHRPRRGIAWNGTQPRPAIATESDPRRSAPWRRSNSNGTGQTADNVDPLMTRDAST
jgi:hypothetical protein